MIKTNRMILLLALLMLGAPFLLGVPVLPPTGVSRWRRHHFYPVDACFFFFPAPWFVVTDEELEAISQNQDLINDYVDEEGNLVFSRPEAYTTEEVLLLNGKTLETCRISAKEDLNEYSLETFASNMFDQMQEDMDEISLPQTWSTGKYKGVCHQRRSQDSTLHYKYYYLHEKALL